jgi:hypothetical protein
MTEQLIQKALKEATGTMERQRLLKQLWKLRPHEETESKQGVSRPDRRADAPPDGGSDLVRPGTR